MEPYFFYIVLFAVSDYVLNLTFREKYDVIPPCDVQYAQEYTVIRRYYFQDYYSCMLFDMDTSLLKGYFEVQVA